MISATSATRRRETVPIQAGPQERAGDAERLVMPTKKRGADPRDPGGSFVTHRKYLDAFALLAGQREDGDLERSLEDLASRVGDIRWAEGSQPAAGLEAAERGMRSAWGTEMLMEASAVALASDPTAQRWMGNWAVVQTYYACYHAFLALTVVRRTQASRTHAAAQRKYVDLWTNKKFDLVPWTLGYDSDGAFSGTLRRFSPPAQRAFSNATLGNAEAKAVTAIRTTRRGAVEDAEDEERDERRKARAKALKGRVDGPAVEQPSLRLSPADRASVESGVRPHSMLDYLYRLRLRMNYLDADMFAKGAGGHERATDTVERLRYLVASTCLVHEMRIVASVGHKRMHRWMDELIDDCDHRPVALTIRRQLIATTAG